MKELLIACAFCMFLAACASSAASGPFPTTLPTVQPTLTGLPISTSTPTNSSVPTSSTKSTATATNSIPSTSRATITATSSRVPDSQTGYLEGHVNIGPLVPVEQIDVPTPTTRPEVYAARSINILQTDGKTLVTNVKINSNGDYRVELRPGVYIVALAKSGVDRANGLPQQINIENGKTVRLDIAIDTGIR